MYIYVVRVKNDVLKIIIVVKGRRNYVSSEEAMY
jgi:hypothetical protein